MTKYFLIALLALSCATHLFFFPHPAQVVFDEVYFGAYASDYISGKYYFDPHPPLGKLLIAAAGSLSGITNDTTSYASIGDPYQTDIYIWYRLFPLIAGILLPLVVYWLCRRLRLSELAAFFAGLLVILDNSLLTQSRFIFMDSMLILFGFTALALYLTYRSRRQVRVHEAPAGKAARSRTYLWWLLAASFAGALSFDIKWTGLAFSLIIALIEVWDLIHASKKRRAFKAFSLTICAMLAVGFAVYYATFAVHFSLLPRSGQGNAFMSAAFQKTLADSQYHDDPSLSPPGTLAKFTELNLEMYAVNAHMNATHEYSSKWYTWPLMMRPIFYWQQAASSTLSTAPADQRSSYIYLFGNPFIYWLGSLVMAWLVLSGGFILARDGLKRGWKLLTPIHIFIVAAFLANYIPFIFIGRVMFLYHYQAALVFTIIGIAYAFESFNGAVKRRYASRSSSWLRHLGSVLGGAAIALALAAFVFWTPITYGWPISQHQLQERMWFPSWR